MALRSVSCGIMGPDVVAIQQGLNKFHNQWLLDPDGVFGNETNKVVCRFQEEQGMVPPDGIVGPITRSALFPYAAATVNIWARRSPGGEIAASWALSCKNFMSRGDRSLWDALPIIFADSL